MKKIIFLFGSLFVIGTAIQAQQKPAPFKKGERAVFVGNSITDGGHYHSYIWLYYMTHFPNDRIDVFNAGIGGDVAEQIYRRWDADVVTKKPTALMFTFGMNDSGYFDFFKDDADELAKKAVNKSYDSFLKIEQKLKQLPNVKKTVMISSPYDETVRLSGNKPFPKKSLAMLQIAKFQEDAAKQNNWGLVDFNRPMTAINEREQKNDTSFTLCGKDRIHPDNDGHMVMAYIFLKAQGLSGKEVADVVVNATKKQIEKSINCKITNLVATGSKVSFDYLANSLPYPLDTIARGWMQEKSQALAMQYVPFMDEFNKESLTIRGLNANSNYTVKIDGQSIGKWTGNALGNGINLAAIPATPQYQQASTIMYLNEERFEIERRFRNYAWMEFSALQPRGLLFKDDLNTMDTLNKLAPTDWAVRGNLDIYKRARNKEIRDVWQKQMDDIVSEIYVINKPKTRKIEIVKD